MSELIIKIGGEADDFKEALADVKKQTESLEGQLTSIAAVSAVAFAALTAEVYLSVKAFGVEQKAIGEVTLALQNQGIFTQELSKQYRAAAEAIERKTGIDSDAVSTGQALAQGLIGQTKITDELTQAVVDLSVAKKIDLSSAFEIVGKGIAGNTAALKKMGIDLDENATKEERLAAVTEKLNQKFQGQAEQAAKAGGGLILLDSAVGNLQKAIGSRLEPVLSKVVQSLTNFVNAVTENGPLVDFIVSVGAGALAFTGLVTAVAGGVLAFAKVRAAMIAANIAIGGTSIAIKGLIGATGIGILVIVLAELYLNWESVWPRMQAVFETFVNNIKPLATGLGKVLFGAFSYNLVSLKEGITELKDAFKVGFKEYGDLVDKKIAEDKKADETQNADKAAAANEANAIEVAALNRSRALRAAEADLLRAMANDESKAIIDLKKQEVELLKQIEDDKNEAIRGSLMQRLEEVRLLEAEAIEIDREQRLLLQSEILAENEEFAALTAEQKALFNLQSTTDLATQIQTESQLRIAAATKTASDQIKFNNEYLENQRKFGKAYADLQFALRQKEVQGSLQATNELAALQSSSNATLFGIGKAAAIANVSVKTAESAMNIYAGFSTIPIVGPALGIAGAAAAVAFGGEQIKKIASTPKPVKAASGGLITGGIPGLDSVPAMLMPGELVVPTRNFEEVVGAVSSNRSGQQSGSMEIVLKLQDNLMDFIETKLVERQNLNLSIQGV
jgi:hypothetical protein